MKNLLFLLPKKVKNLKIQQNIVKNGNKIFYSCVQRAIFLTKNTIYRGAKNFLKKSKKMFDKFLKI